MSAEPLGEPTLVERSICSFCGGNYLLRGEKYVRIVERQASLNIKVREPGNGYPAQRVCYSVVPMSETLCVCAPCWLNEHNRELEKYALAPFAAYVQEVRTI